MNELNDKELLKQLNAIKADTESIDIPDSVKPENMMKYIEQREQMEQADNIIKMNKGCFEESRINNKDNKESNKNKKDTIFKRIGKAIKKNQFLQGGIAASLVVGILTTAAILTVDNDSQPLSEQYQDMIKVSSEEDNGISTLNGYSNLHRYLVAENTKERKYTLLEQIKRYFSNWGTSEDSIMTDDELNGSMDMAPEGEGNMGTGNEDYSDTNTRTENVDESDVIKTDGKYIYYIEKTGMSTDVSIYLTILKADGKETEVVSKVALKDTILKVAKENGKVEENYRPYNKTLEIMLYKDKLTVITEYSDMTLAIFYDVTDKTNPKLINTLFMDGRYDGCRLANNYLYLSTTKLLSVNIEENKEILSEEEAKKLLGIKTSEGTVECEDIYVSASQEFDTYVIIGTIDMENTTRFKQVKTVVGSETFGTLYMGAENIYYITQMPIDTSKLGDDSKEEKLIITDKSAIISMAYKDGEITPTAVGYIDGVVGDEFDVDEYNGYLRLAVSVAKSECFYQKCNMEFYDGKSWITEEDWMPIQYSRDLERYSSLYVLDSELKIVGSIPKLKEEEEVYGVRFDGDIGYVVTYRQMDPLFSIDLSDPANPKVIGELKIPGFSEYLHKWDDNTLIGLGYDEFRNIKISTFDITDKTNVYERDICTLEYVYYTDALYNHRAVLISPSKNLIGFSCNNGEVYNIYTYIDGKLTEVISQDLRFGKHRYYPVNTRGLYIGDYIYIVNEKEGIFVYDINTFEKVK